MMKFKVPSVFKIIPAEEVEMISYIRREDLDRTTFDGHSLGATWEPIRVERITEDQGQKWIPGDLPGHNVGDLVLNRKAKDKIGAFLEQYGELLPLACDDGEFWTLNVTCMIDALDESKSSVMRSKDPGRLLMIHKFAFRPEALESAVIFRLPQYARGSIFVATPFVELIKSSGLTGLVFKQIWAPN
jgi:hypothetical protein